MCALTTTKNGSVSLPAELDARTVATCVVADNPAGIVINPEFEIVAPVMPDIFQVTGSVPDDRDA
ncbi:hypothetical protein F4Y43_06905 [Candidatus Poribacteria bacterium]|nr:hypothetical protein [Candidatus Poribacteria bacterium]